MWPCCCCQNCSGTLTAPFKSLKTTTFADSGSPAVWDTSKSPLTLPAGQSGSIAWCFKFTPTQPTLTVSGSAAPSSGSSASGFFVGSLFRVGVDWGSGLPFMEPCDENGQSAGARQLTTRPEFCPATGNNGLGLEMDIFGQQGPDSTTFGIEVWTGSWYVLWQQSVPWTLDTFNVGYFGEGGATVSGLTVQCGTNEPGQICAPTQHPMPPSWDLTASVSANPAWTPTPGYDGENGCCALSSGTFRLRNLPTLQESSLQRFFYAPPTPNCNGSVTFRSCASPGQSGTHFNFAPLGFGAPPNFGPRPPANPYNPMTTTYDYTDNLSAGGSFASVPPLWLLQVLGPDPQHPQSNNPNGQYLAIPSFGNEVGMGYMLDASQWNCQGTNVLSQYGTLLNPAFSFGCTMPLTVSVTPAWSW